MNHELTNICHICGAITSGSEMCHACWVGLDVDDYDDYDDDNNTYSDDYDDDGYTDSFAYGYDEGWREARTQYEKYPLFWLAEWLHQAEIKIKRFFHEWRKLHDDDDIPF